MPEIPSHLELAYSSIRVFADDGTIDMGELNFLLGIALRDGKIDDDERRVLRNIFSKVSENTVSPKVWERICETRSKYSI
ncbi:MAG: hypothetical protein GY795_51615 [Desulfobacterales bacterium]|nr:hypothetical protein [Desulfobacterales bacterium]